MKIYLIIFILLTALFSCKTAQNKQLDEGKIKGGKYYNKEIGWTMDIPKGWNITPMAVLEERTKKSLNEINEVSGTNHEFSKLKRLLNLHKDRFHIFETTLEPFELHSEEKWEENITRNKKIIYETYIRNGIKIDTSSSKEIIDNLEFDVFHIELDGLNELNGKIFYDLYITYINGLEFIAGLNYMNEKEKNEMMEVWKNSKFE